LYLRDNQQNEHFLYQCFNSNVDSSTCFEHPSGHLQEDLYMQFYGISFKHPYKQSGRWQDVPDTPILPSTRLLIVCISLVLITEIYHDARFKKKPKAPL